MQSDGALMKKHIKNISRNDVSAVHKAYGLCNGNSSCELIKLHVFKSDSCTLNLSSQIPYGIKRQQTTRWGFWSVAKGAVPLN